MATSCMPNVSKNPTRRRTVAPRVNHSCSTGPVPLSGSTRTSNPSSLNRRTNGIATLCRVTGCSCRSLICHELDFPALAFRPVSTS